MKRLGGLNFNEKELAFPGLKDFCQAIARSDEWVFNPHEEYEVFGDVDKVVFPCEWILILIRHQ